MAEATWTCDCGQMAARIEIGSGLHLICFCDDCQAFARATGQPGWLDDAGGSDLYQTTPDHITMLRGADQLACLRLTKKGPFRWYAACCGAPFANTLTTGQVPFSSISVKGLDDPKAVGPVRLHANRKFASRRVAEKGSIARAGVQILYRAATARLAGKHRDTPFFDDSGSPKATVRLLDDAERRRAYAPGPGH